MLTMIMNQFGSFLQENSGPCNTAYLPINCDMIAQISIESLVSYKWSRDGVRSAFSILAMLLNETIKLLYFF